MKESKRWQDILIGVGILAAATFLIAGACGLVCAIFMLPLGFRYESLWDIVVFFFGAVSWPSPCPWQRPPCPRPCTPWGSCLGGAPGCCTWRWTPLPSRKGIDRQNLQRGPPGASLRRGSAPLALCAK